MIEFQIALICKSSLLTLLIKIKLKKYKKYMKLKYYFSLTFTNPIQAIKKRMICGAQTETNNGIFSLSVNNLKIKFT